jgi:hypothetical protein
VDKPQDRKRWVKRKNKVNLEPQYPLNRKLGGPQSQSGQFGGEKNLVPLPGFEPLAV